MNKCQVREVLTHLGDYPLCQSTVTRTWEPPPYPMGMYPGMKPASIWLCDLHYREAEQRFYGRDVLVHGYRSETEWWDG